ncbi:MAG: ankyrin repeat domain-containing protein [Proteobacteria bacterium]|nr:ankyrin repeat domain-containing protein [Pseudomonadota bacterium]
MKNMKREEAEAKVVAFWGKNVSGVSKNLSVLVATSESGAKWTKAQELNSKGANIQFWTEEQFMAELKKAESSSAGKAGKKPSAHADAGATKTTKPASKPKLTAKQLEKLNKDLLKAASNYPPSIEKIKSLIEAGADINAKDDNGKTPLHWCVSLRSSNDDIAKLLIGAGADVNAKDNKGRTPLHWCRKADIVKVLIGVGADVNAKDNDGKTWLHYFENADIAKILIDAGADVNAKDNDGKTPLHHSLNDDIVKVLINAGADINAKDNDGRTPLHYFVDYDAAKVLIDAGADVNAKDNDGGTPLHYCEDYDVAKVLVDAGADVNAENNDGETPLDHGVDLWEDDDIEDLLVKAGAVRYIEAVGDDRIFELVKKYLAEAAPNSMTCAEIINKLKRDGLPETMTFSSHAVDLMKCWAKKGIIVCVGRGVYKLADK